MKCSGQAPRAAIELGLGRGANAYPMKRTLEATMRREEMRLFDSRAFETSRPIRFLIVLYCAS
jgi:hypothetical protein